MDTVTEIPASAISVKVTNVASPSFMKIYHEDSFTDRLNAISEKLRLFMKKKSWKKIADQVEPQRGHPVIIKKSLELELPAWWVRGILGNFNKQTSKFNVFLVDHGYTIKVDRKDFTIISRRAITDDYLTVTVSLHEIIPAAQSSEVSPTKENVVKPSTKWSETAIRITRECVAAASKLYFNYTAKGDNNEYYGELFLVLDMKIVSLAEILICKNLAIHLTKDLISTTKNLNFDTMKKSNATDSEIVIDISAAEKKESEESKVASNLRRNDSQKKETRGELTLKKRESIRYVGEDCQRILIHSNTKCDPLRMIVDARFPGRIHAALQKLSIIALREIQTYMWPAITKELSVLAVGPSNSGKTIGYVLPIISNIVSWKELPKGKDPSILILCSSTSEVLNVQALCSELLEDYSDIRSVAAYNGRPNRSLVANIYNGCQILIATPPYLVRFINQDAAYKKLLNLSNLSHFVIDGIDDVLDKYYEPLRTLMTKHVQLVKKKECQDLDKRPLQIVAVAHKWSPLLNEFAKQCMTDPYVCIGSYIEAAVYGRVKPKLCFLQRDKKMEKLSELLGEHVKMMKTIIVCCNSDEARALEKYLSASKKTLIACEKMTIMEIYGVKECWKVGVSGLYPILICTDQVLVDLNITDVDWLIHYSIALPSKTQFYFRFSTIMKNLEKGEEGKCKVTIIVDETNDVQLGGVVDVVKRCGTKLSATFTDKVLRIVATLDREKKMFPICDNVKAFGICPKKNSCPYRHCVLKDVDSPATKITRGDSVRLIVTYVHNATHFTARILEFTKSDKQVVKYSAEEYTKTSAMIQTFYAQKSNRRYRRKNVCVGDIFALEESLDNFQRVKVLNIVEKDCDNVPIAVELKCIDTGLILSRISATQLMELPEELANRETHIVEIFLAGLSPFDAENEWNLGAINDAHSWFPDKTKSANSFLLGKVCLHLADTLWVDPLEIHTKIISYPDLVSTSLKRHLIRLGHGVENKNHLPHMYELCKIGGLTEVIDDATDSSSSHN